MKIVTISREFGSGGRELGKRLADELGYAYYDREVITHLAEKCSLDEGYIEKTIEQGAKMQYPFSFSLTFSRMPSPAVGNFSNLLLQQRSVVKELAAKGDCVIVGRGADVILEEYNPFKIFVCADMPSKLARCKARAAENENLSDRELMKKIKQVDKSRAQTHALISSTLWGNPHNYHLCINTTDMDIKLLIPEIAAYVRLKPGTND